MLGDLTYQRNFFDWVLKHASISEMSKNLGLHPNTIRKWVKCEQRSPYLSYAAFFMYIKIKSNAETFNVEMLPTELDLNKLRNEKLMKEPDFVKIKNKYEDFFHDALDKNEIYVNESGIVDFYCCLNEKVNFEYIIENTLIMNKKEKENNDIIKPRKEISNELFSSYISLYPSLSLIKIQNAYKLGLVNHDVIINSLKKRLSFINDNYYYFICNISNDVENKINLDIFNYNKDSFNPDEFETFFYENKINFGHFLRGFTSSKAFSCEVGGVKFS